MTPLAALGWTGLLGLITVTCVRVTDLGRPGAAEDWVNLGACHVLAVLVVVFAVVRVYEPNGSVRDSLGIRAPASWQLVLAGGLGAGLYPILSMIDRTVLRWLPYDAEDIAELEKLATTHSVAGRVILVVMAFGVVPVARELFFRGLLFERIAKTASTRTAIILTTVLFAISFDVRTVPSTVILGLALGRLRSCTGTVLGPIFGAIAFWAVPSVPVLGGMDPSADITYSTRYVVGGAIAAALALVLVGRRSGGSAGPHP